jgi:hypothetical protein
VRWEWYSDDAYDLRPYWYERNRYRRGRRLERRPTLSEDVVQYGFDDAGRVVVRREFSGFLGGRLTFEATRTYLDGAIEEVGVDGDGTNVYVHRYLFDDDLLHTFIFTARHGQGREEYGYTVGRVTSIDASHDGRPYQKVAIGYDEAGRLRRIETTWLQGRAHTVTTYRRRPAGFTVDGRCRDLVAMLAERVPAAVAREQIGEPACCLALVYNGESCVPLLGIGLESERQAWLASGDATELMWNPAEFEHYDTDAVGLDDPGFRDSADLLDQELALKGELDRVRVVLLEAAHALNRYDWSRALPITADFIVYPVDYELADLDHNLGECRRRLSEPAS